MDLSGKIRAAGVVGAGGAGFPTHIKAESKAEYVLANGAECEPLIHKDFEIMVSQPEKIVRGMRAMMDSAGASSGKFGVKGKNKKAIEEIEKYIPGTGIEMTVLGDFYPSGDEYELVYEATGKLIPPHGIPLNVGCLVNNVETFYNISNAIDGIPVTEKFVCVTGMVKNPSSFFVPVGTSYKELIEIAGGTTTDNYVLFVSGILMGKLTYDESEVVTKTCAGIIILPADHYLVHRMDRPVKDMNRIGKSACDQCSYCTEFCPRYLLGYDVQPHKVMRSLVFTTSGREVWNKYADLCCSCGLCSLYACPEDLYPREACNQSKAEMRSMGLPKYEQPKPVKVHPVKSGRRVPLKQLMKRLDLTRFDSKTPFRNDIPAPENVKIYLKQHVGAASVPVVNTGDIVQKGDLIAEIPENQLGANIHASISGMVTHVSNDFIRIKRN